MSKSIPVKMIAQIMKNLSFRLFISFWLLDLIRSSNLCRNAGDLRRAERNPVSRSVPESELDLACSRLLILQPNVQAISPN